MAVALPSGLFLNSWGPDDDGKTVDGPHQLGKVSEVHEDRETQDAVFIQILQLPRVAPFPALRPFVVPDSRHPALPPPFGRMHITWGWGTWGTLVLREVGQCFELFPCYLGLRAPLPATPSLISGAHPSDGCSSDGFLSFLYPSLNLLPRPSAFGVFPRFFLEGKEAIGMEGSGG